MTRLHGCLILSHQPTKEVNGCGFHCVRNSDQPVCPLYTVISHWSSWLVSGPALWLKLKDNYWSTMSDDISKHIATCRGCATAKMQSSDVFCSATNCSKSFSSHVRGSYSHDCSQQGFPLYLGGYGWRVRFYQDVPSAGRLSRNDIDQSR